MSDDIIGKQLHELVTKLDQVYSILLTDRNRAVDKPIPVTLESTVDTCPPHDFQQYTRPIKTQYVIYCTKCGEHRVF